MNRFLRALCVFSWIGVILWAATIFLFSSLNDRTIDELNALHLWDKAAHYFAFAAGGVLLALALRMGFHWRLPVIFRRTMLILALYAASDEWHQSFTPGRHGSDVRDWMADVFGVACGAGLVWITLAVRKARTAAPVKDCEAA